VGDSAVGKTSLITAFLDPQLKFNSFHKPTPALSFETKILVERNLKLQIW
jgi:GTPase SAR1 family protein